MSATEYPVVIETLSKRSVRYLTRKFNTYKAKTEATSFRFCCIDKLPNIYFFNFSFILADLPLRSRR